MVVIAIIGGLLLAGIIIYGFRQGMKVTPDDRPDRSGQTNYAMVAATLEVDRLSSSCFSSLPGLTRPSIRFQSAF